MTEWSSEPRPAPEGVGALSRARPSASSLPLRQPGNRVRLRVRVPPEVLVATEEGLAALDEDQRPVLADGTPPPVAP